MKRLVYIYIGLILCVTLSSCSDYVEIDERGEAVALSVSDLRLVLNGTIENGFFNKTYFSDEVKSVSDAAYTGMFYESSRRAFRFDDFIYNETEDDLDWSNHYKAISTSNYVINQVDKLTDPIGERDQVLGEALVHRAFAYFELVNMYASNYTDATAATDLGVPLVTEFGNPSVSLQRASVQDVYDLIIADLTEASNLLFDVSDTGYKPNRPSAYGMLAKAYLQMGKYNLAKENAQKALAIKNTLLDYNTLPVAPVALNFDFVNLKYLSVRPGEIQNPETIWHAANQINVDIAPVLDGSIISREPTIPFILTLNTGFVTDEVFALGNSYDIRFSNMMLDIKGFKRFFGLGNFLQTNGLPYGVNVPELILIQAESEARIGDFNIAMSQLNNFRQKRFLNSAPAGSHILTAANQAEAIQHVLDERQREFMYRGLRMFDIKRLNAHHNAGISATHILPTDGSTLTLPANDPKWNMAIPPKEIAIAPEIEQNPRN